jgi:hypothetical protein
VAAITVEASIITAAAITLTAAITVAAVSTVAASIAPTSFYLPPTPLPNIFPMYWHKFYAENVTKKCT